MGERRVAPPPPGAENPYAFIRFLDGYVRGDPPEYRERAEAYLNRLAEQAQAYREAATLRFKADQIDAQHEKAEAWEKQAREAFSAREEAVDQGERDLRQREADAKTDIAARKDRADSEIRERGQGLDRREAAVKEREDDVAGREGKIDGREAAAENAKKAGQAERKKYAGLIAKIEAVKNEAPDP